MKKTKIMMRVTKNMDIKISCTECKSCNRKGKPSVMRGSAYCDSHRKKYTYQRKGIFGWISKKFFSRLNDKMFDRRYDKKKGMNTKGFRQEWFAR